MNDELSWKTARSLAELGELTARWLEGTEPNHPCCTEGPDEETSPLIAELAALNRAGFVTDFSQPASQLDGGSGQRACVCGFCSEDIARRIAALGLWTDLLVIAFPPGCDGGHYIPITIDEHRPFSWAGRYGLDEIDHYAESCGQEAVEQLTGSWMVQVVDPQWGRSPYLWSHVAEAVLHRRPSPFNTTPADATLGDFVW